MNKQRRAELDAIMAGVEEVMAGVEEVKALLETIKDDIESAQADEQEYFDNMPESLQGGEKGSDAEAAINEMQAAADAVGDVIDALDIDLDDVITQICAAKAS